ncbi:hypothetical protein [Thiolapillus sp.]|nr:hypothetical protein [Thiolapillus sp.]
MNSRGGMRATEMRYFYFVIFPHPSADRILWQPVVAGVALE